MLILYEHYVVIRDFLAIQENFSYFSLLSLCNLSYSCDTDFVREFYAALFPFNATEFSTTLVLKGEVSLFLGMILLEHYLFLILRNLFSLSFPLNLKTLLLLIEFSLVVKCDIFEIMN